MATDAEKLRAEVAALRVVVTELVEQLPAQVELEVAAKTIPREEYARRVRASGRRTVAGLVLLLLVIVGLVVWNRVTLTQANDQAIGDFRRLITVCRTTGPPLSAADRAYCNARVPAFDAARARAIATAATAKRNQARLDRLEREVARLLE